MKYVMLERDISGVSQRVPIIFPDLLVHQDIANLIRHDPQLRGSKVVSAGFISFKPEISCHGESETLKLTAGEDDARTIAHFDYLHGIVT